MPLSFTQVRDLEDRRAHALASADSHALRALFAPECRYVHANGRLDTGSSYIANLEGSGFRYLHLEVSEQQIVVHEDAAVVVCRQDAVLRIEDQEVTSVSRCTAVWSGTGVSARLIAFQSTSLPTP